MGNGKGKVVPAQSTRKSTASFQGGPSTIRLMSVIPEENVEAFIAIYHATRNVGILGMPQEYFTARDALHSLMKKGAIDDHYTWKAISELLDKIDEKESTVTANYAQELLKRKLGSGTDTKRGAPRNFAREILTWGLLFDTELYAGKPQCTLVLDFLAEQGIPTYSEQSAIYRAYFKRSYWEALKNYCCLMTMTRACESREIEFRLLRCREGFLFRAGNYFATEWQPHFSKKYSEQIRERSSWRSR